MCGIYVADDPKVEQEMDEQQKRNASRDFFAAAVRKTAARDAMFPELVRTLNACRKGFRDIAELKGVSFDEACPSLNKVIADAEKLL